MEELWPDAAVDVDIAARLAGDVRTAPEGRPWITMVMIASLDDAVEIDGVSGGLGGPADHERFIAARRLADGILVGAGTVRAEDYRPTKVPVAVITGSLSLDPRTRLFDDPDRPPLLYTTTQAAQDRGPDFDGIAEVIDVGNSLHPTSVLRDLRRRGLRHITLEGGPTLNGQMLVADVVDEALLTISPKVVGGDAGRIVAGPTLDPANHFGLDRVMRADDLLFARYLRRR